MFTKNGESRGYLYQYTVGVEYDVRIELKPGRGARYWIRPTGQPNWTFLYNSTHGSDTEFLCGATGDNGSFIIESVREVHWGSPLERKTFVAGPVTLTVRDLGGQEETVTFDVTADPATPTADAGGPYTRSEGDPDPNSNAWTFTLDGSGTTGGQDIERYEWDFGIDTFNGVVLDPLRWATARAGQSDRLMVLGAGWGNSYAFNREVTHRSGGAVIQARIVPTNGSNSMWGLKNTSDVYHYTQMPYAMYFRDNSWIYVYEDGNNRGYLYQYTQGVAYDVRIELYSPCGARYYVRRADETDWHLIYNSVYGTNDEFLVGADVNTGRFVMDDLMLRNWGPSATHVVHEPTPVTLTVTDTAGQTSSETAVLDIVGDPPVAASGGPYVLNEAELLANKFQEVTFDGSASTDDFGVVRYQWDFPTDTFDTAELDSSLWAFERATLNGKLSIAGTGGWGGAYAFSRQVMHRSANQVFECQVGATGNRAMCGLKNTGGDYNYTQMPYAVYFNYGTIEIYEDGTNRGSAISYSTGATYVIRIVLGETAGATYWIRGASNPDWTLLYVSSYGSATEFLRGITVQNGTFEFDNLRNTFLTNPIPYRVTGQMNATLTVFDAAGRSDSAVATVVALGDSPVADVGGPYIAPLGSYAVLDGSGSSDDYGIVRYEWDFGDGHTGYGKFAQHIYDAVGVYTVALTVYDAAGRSDTDTTQVDVQPMAVCVPWDYDNISGLEVPHNAWDGMSAQLKAVVFTDTPVDANQPLSYTWTFGDGSDPETGATGSTRVIETTHIYNGSPGALYTATLTVHDPVYGDLTDTYPLQIHARDLTIEVNVAIDDGLWWLHKQQNTDGSWSSYSSYRSGSTASSIHAMEINGHVPMRPVTRDPLVADVIHGFERLFTYLTAYAIGSQPYGNPDSNGNELGIGVNDGQPIYQGGMVMDALAAAGEPDLVAGTGSGGVVGRTYRDIAQDMGDMYSWGQEDDGGGRGGWRYDWNVNADNSACQWAAIGFSGTKTAFGLDAPTWVKDENDIWLNYSYNGTGFGYSSSSGGSWATTPSGLVQLAFCGFDRSDPRWQTAETYLANSWSSFLSADGSNFVYAWYAFAKAMRLALPEPITTLNPTGLDWYNSESGLIRHILNQQLSDGGWPDHRGRVFASAWQIVILTPTLFTRPPVAVAGDDIVWAFDRPLVFDASASYHTDPVRVLEQYEWDFDGDGTYDYVGADPNVLHTFWQDPNVVYPITYQSRLRVTDDIGQTDVDTRLVTIAEPPHAPFAVIGGPYTTNVGVPFHPDGSGSFDIDPTDYITRQEWDFNGADGYDFDNADAAVDCNAPPDDCPQVEWVYTTPGSYNIGLRVWDNAVLHPNNEKLPSLPDFTTVLVLTNHAPVAVIAEPDVVIECTQVQLDGTGSYDEDANPLTYAWDLDEDGEYDDATGPAPTYTWYADGVYQVGLIVSDGGENSEPAFADVTVLDGVPTISVSGPSALGLDQLGNFEADAQTPCDQLDPIEWDWDYNGVVFSASGDTGATQTHSYSAQGNYVVAARVIDSDGSEALATTEVIVAPPEGPRVPAGERMHVIIGVRDYDAAAGVHRGEFTLVSDCNDPITGPIGLAFDNIEPASVTLLNIAGVVPHPTETGQTLPYIEFSHLLTNNTLMPGEAIGPLWIEFADAQNLAFTFDAIPYLFNTPPRFVSTPITVGVEGQRYRYHVEAVDDDGDVVGYALADAPVAPDGMTIHPLTGLVDWMPAQDAAGGHAVAVVAYDNHDGGEATQAFEIAIEAVDVPPVIHSAPLTTALVGEPYAYTVDALDPDGDIVTFELLEGPTGMTLDPASGLLEWPAPEVGPHAVKLRASDPADNAVEQEFVLLVNDCADPPVIIDPPPQSTSEGTLYSYQVEAGGTGALSYALSVGPGGMAIDADGLITWDVPYTAAGTHAVKVMVSSTANCRAELIYSLDVTDENAAPVFTSTPITAATEGALYVYNAVASDADGDVVAYSVVDGPAGLTIHPLVGRVTWLPPQDAGAGSPYTVILAASDASGASGQQVYTLTVDTIDLGPQITSDPVYGALEDTWYEYQVVAVDPDGGTLTYVLDSGPAGMTLDPNSGLLRWLPDQTAAQYNPHAVALHVSDPAGHTASQVFEIHVHSSNVPPTITSTPVTTATEGEIYTYLVTALDIDDDELSFGLVEYPGGMNIHPDTGLITWLVPQTAAATGPHAVTVGVSDGLELVTQSYEITADAVNVAPMIFSEPVTEAAVGAAYAYQVLANDLDGDVIDYTLSDAPAGMTVDPNAGLIEWLPAAGQDGPQSVTVVASDPAGLFDEQAFEIDVAPCADAPVFVTDPVTVGRPDVAYDYDVDAETQAGTVTYALDTAPAGMAIDGASGLITWLPTAGQIGVHDVTVVATRDGVCPSTQVFEIDVRECALTVTYHQPTLVPGWLATFVPQVDATCPPVSFELLTNPDGMIINPTTGVVQWIAEVGPFAAEVLATDGWGTTQTIALGDEVLVETAPRITSTPPFTAQVGVLYTYAVEAEDDENDTLTFSLDAAPLGMTIDSAGGLIEWTPAAWQIGTHEVIVRVDDGRGWVVTQTYPLTVSLTGSNHPPEITSTPTFSAAAESEYTYALTASDADGDPVALSLDQAPAGASLDGATDTITWTPTLTQIGSHAFVVRAEDGQGGWATQSFHVAVSLFGDNTAPRIVSAPTYTAVLNAPYVYAVAAEDDDGDALSYALDTAPAGMSIDAGGQINWTPIDGQLGTHDVALRADDGRGGWATQEYAVTVSLLGDNVAPHITSQPPRKAAFDTLYTYGVQARDDDGDVLSYALLDAPPTMGVDSVSGVIEWTPSPIDLGTHRVELMVDDGRGGIATQRYTLTVSADGLNGAPWFISVAPTTVVVGDDYIYPVAADDDANQPLLFSLPVAPPAMTIDPATGLIAWTPIEADLGVHDVTVHVEDAQSAWAEQTFTLTVSLNSPPSFISTAPTRAIVGYEYRYDVLATDPDGHPRTYALIVAPDGMSINEATGLVTWTPAADQVGPHGVEVAVTDILGAMATQPFTVDVFESADEDLYAPEVSITVDPPAVAPGETVTISVTATDDFAIASLTLTVNGDPVALDAEQQAEYTTTAPGAYVAEATATDVVGHSTVATADFYASVTGDVTPPTVAITAPTADATVTTRMDVIGTVDDDNLYRYTLSYRPVGEGEFTQIAAGYDTVTNGVLGQLDPATMANGVFELRLRAMDTAGHVSEVTQTHQLDTDLSVGNFTLMFTDLNIPVAGVPVSVTRAYDSRDRAPGDFGYGWKLTVERVQLQESSTLGADWEQIVIGGWFPTYVIQPTRGKYVAVTFEDGVTEFFALRVDPDQQSLSQILFLDGVSFVPLDGAESTLEVLDAAPTLFNGMAPGPGELVVNGNQPWDPQTYRVTRPDGRQYTFVGAPNSLVSRLQQFKDPSGNVLSFTENGITHSCGLAVNFERDGQGRITRIVDPRGNAWEYEYDGRGDLVAVTDAAGYTTEFAYNNRHGLREIVDPRGNAIARNVYDDEGRLIAAVDAAGYRTEFAYDDENNTQTVTDRLGHTHIYAYNDEGKVIEETDELGYVTTFTYDDDGNLLTRTDALDHTTTQTYDSRGNVLTETDPLGHTTTYTYNSRNQVLTETDPLGHMVTNEYDAFGRLIRRVNQLGDERLIAYDTNGNVTSLTDELGNVVVFEYDTFGRQTRKTDARGVETTYTYDENGNRLTESTTRQTDGGPEVLTTAYVYDAMNRVVQTVDPNGAASFNEYNETGQLAATIDRLGRRTEYEYEIRGLRTRALYADGTEELWSYDAEGQQVEATDRAGFTTTYTYDPVGRQTRKTHYDGTFSEMVYDEVGRVLSEIDARGNATDYVYDDAGRQTHIIDALDHETVKTYDAADRLETTTDANGHTTTYVRDAAGRNVQVIFHDGTSLSSVFDAGGRRISSTDPGGNTVQFEYDERGKLVRVTDPLGNTADYTYDEFGHLLTQADALGNVTEYEYDNLGRRSSTMLPLGMDTDRQYDPEGNLIARTDYNGATISYEYDSNNRLARKLLPGGAEVTYTYTPIGRRESVTDSRGVTAYTYDGHGRLLTVADPNGATLVYEYDAMGNRTSLTAPSGETTYTYDALNRLETVTDPNGATSTYTYDAAGNRASITYPNGTQTNYLYDDLNRLTYMETIRVATSEIVAAYVYELGPLGNRTRVVEHTGRTVDYTYDALYRLVREEINDPDGSQTVFEHSYDAVGNRTRQVVTHNGSVTETTYTYDDNCRLVSEVRTVLVVAAPRTPNGTVLTRYDQRPSIVPAAVLTGFSVASLWPLLLPLGLLRRRPANLGRAARRRRVIVQTIALVMLPTMIVGAEHVQATDIQAMQEHAKATLYDQRLAPVTTTYAYDDNGNLSSRSDGVATDTYTFDAEDRLVSADVQTGAAPGLVAYVYDADGTRVSKTADGQTTHYLVDCNRANAQIIEQHSGGVVTTYLHGDDLISMRRADTSPRYYVYDGQMSTRMLTDSTGNVTDAYVYDAFGNLIAQAGTTPNEFRYTGEQYDPNVGFYYLRARYYDPAAGRFISTDPCQGSVFDPPSLHKYLYTKNNPVNHVDPSGEMLLEIMISLVVAMLLVTFLGWLVKASGVRKQTMEAAGIKMIKWEGNLTTAGGSVGIAGGSLVGVVLTPDDDSGETYTWSGAVGGPTVGISFGGTSGRITLESLMPKGSGGEADPAYLTGTITISGSISLAAGSYSLSAGYMEMGDEMAYAAKGDISGISLDPNSSGLAVGLAQVFTGRTILVED